MGADPTQNFTIESVPIDGSAPIRLTASPWPLASPTFSPDGRTVAFVYDLDSVHLVGADGTGEHALNGIVDAYDGAALLTPFWSPDGTTLIAAAHRWLIPDPRSQSATVYRFDASSGSVGILHPGQYASLSRDGRYLAYQTFVDPHRPASGGVIGVCRSDGSHDMAFGQGSYAAWTPTMDRLAYVTRAGNLTVSTATGRGRWTLRTMTAGPIAWSPDGKAIYFAHGGSRPGLFVASPGAPRARHLVDLPTTGTVSTSPDGRWIAISVDWLTVLVRSNGTHLQALQGGPAAWSPRGSTLALVSGNVLRVWTPTTGVGILYTGRQSLADPAWSPDGIRILVVNSG